MISKIKVALAGLFVLVVLTGCSNQPSSSEAQKDAEQVSSADRPTDATFAVADLTRENGWAEGDVYKIHYTYNLVSKANYATVIVDLLKSSQQEVRNMAKEDRTAMMMQVGLGNMMSAVSSDAPNVKAALDSYLNYPEVVAYFKANPDFTNDNELVVLSTYLTTNVMQNYAIPKDMPVGTNIPRQVTFTYRKTEKGWLKLS